MRNAAKLAAGDAPRSPRVKRGADAAACIDREDAFPMRLDNFRLSDNIEDQRDWTSLGYDDAGNAYSVDSGGNVYMQPWAPQNQYATDPTQCANGTCPGWGQSQQVGKAPDDLNSDPPTPGPGGKAEFKNKKKKCKTCSGGDDDKKTPSPSMPPPCNVILCAASGSFEGWNVGAGLAGP